MSSYSSNALAHSSVSDSYSSSSLFEPDVVLPGQFPGERDKGLKGGERRLMAALLSDGIEAYVKQATASEVKIRRSRTKFDATEWIDIRDESYVFSFDNVCDCLGIDAEYLRLGLQRYVRAVRREQALNGGAAKVWKKIRRPRKK